MLGLRPPWRLPAASLLRGHASRLAALSSGRVFIAGHHLAHFSRCMVSMPRKKPAELYLEEIPDVCPKCGQNIDKQSAASIQHHTTPKHLPFAGKSARKAWR